MVFEKISRNFTITDLSQIFPGVKVSEKHTAFLVEKTPSGELVYQLTFQSEKLKQIHASINADYTESAYLDLAALALRIVEANAGARGNGGPLEEKAILPWKRLIESPLPGGSDRSIEGLSLEWRTGAKLTLVWNWPGQLCLDYNEEL